MIATTMTHGSANVGHSPVVHASFPMETIDPIVVGDLPLISKEEKAVTIAASLPTETDKSDESDIVTISNAEFLAGRFPMLIGDYSINWRFAA